MPDRELPSPTEPELPKQLIVPKVEEKTPPTSPIALTETPKQGYDDATEEKEETIASPPRRFLDIKYGIRREGEQMMFSDSPVFIDPDANL